MARLTRAQKYADLREKLVNETEEKSASNIINEYEQRLKDLENFFNIDFENNNTQIQELPTEENHEEVKPVEEKFEEIKPQENLTFVPNLSDDDIKNIVSSLDLPEEIKQEEVQEQKPINTIEDFFNSNIQSQQEIIKIEKIVKEEKEEPKFVLEEENDITNAVIENDNDALIDRTKDIAEILDEDHERVVAIEDETVVIPEQFELPKDEIIAPIVIDATEAIEDTQKDIAEILDEDHERVVAIEDEPIKIQEEVAEPIKEETFIQPEIIDNTIIQPRDYLKEALDDVNSFNSQEGNKTFSDIVDSIRHQVEPLVEEKVEIDEEFQNTVNIEIEKIRQALIETEEPQIDVEEVVEEPIQENEAEYFKKFVEETAKEEVKIEEEHPVIAKAISEEETIDIKPYDEVISSTSSNVISDTIPFIIDNKEETVEEEEEEEGEPNTLLNIILIILIVILIAVLAIIGYYILKIKGII